MDKLDAEIAKAKKEVADLKRKAEAKELELKGLQKAAELRPSSQGLPTNDDILAVVGRKEIASDEKAEKRGGRQPGAISKQWRNVLSDIYAGGKNEPMKVDDIAFLADLQGITLQEGSALARMRNYADLGYVQEVKGAYKVTDAAIKRFGLAEKAEKKEP